MNIHNADIKELRNSYDLHQCTWAKRCLDNIEKEMKQLQVKANKYDSLVEKIKKDIEEYPEAKYTKYYLLDCLELLDTEKGE